MKIEKIDNKIYLDGEKLYKEHFYETRETNLKDIVSYITKNIGRDDIKIIVEVFYKKYRAIEYYIEICKKQNDGLYKIKSILVQKNKERYFLNFDKNSSIEEIKKSIQDFKIAVMGEL